MSANGKIRVKLIGNYRSHVWMRQFPGRRPVWDDCQFLLDPAEKHYDWLIVYNDLPRELREENLSCRRENTLLVTTEPHTIKSYGRSFTKQFGHVLTSQPEWALQHPGRIYSQPALQWFYGLGFYGQRDDVPLSFDQMIENPPLVKTKDIATVCSMKQQRHTLHNRRYAFTQKLKEIIPDLDIFGHGVKPMDDKAEALDDYRYHVAIENFRGLHHWTEKLSDPFLGLALPFYYGCTNVFEYFPEESLITIDIDDPETAGETILRAIRDNEYEKRLPYIQQARELVMQEYNLFAVLSKFIGEHHDPAKDKLNDHVLLSRRRLRARHPMIAVEDLLEKVRVIFVSTLGGER